MTERKPIETLVRALRDKGVVLTLEDGCVQYRGPPRWCATDEMLELKARRDETIAYLQSAKLLAAAGAPAMQSRTSPLSCSQRWWWELEAITGPMSQPVFFIQVFAVLDPQVLRAAFTEVASRQEALRTRFVRMSSGVVPIIDPAAQVEMTLADFSCAPTAPAAAAGAFIHAFRLATYELNGGPLFRASVVKLSSEHFIILIGAHHIVIDGWSCEILKRDLAAAYAAFAAGEPPNIPEPRMQLSEFSLWEQQWLQSAGAADPYQFWNDRLKDVMSVELPTDNRRTEQIYGFPEQRQPLRIAEQTVGAVRDLSRRSGTTVQAILLAVYTVLLSWWSRRTEILLGNYMAFRSAPGATELIGCFGGNRPVHVVVAHEAAFRAHLQRVWRAYVLCQDFQKPVGTHIAWGRRLNRVVANFSKANAPASVEPAPPPGWGALPINHELALVLRETPTTISGHISYAANLFLPTTIERFSSDFQRMLHETAVNPAARLAELVPQVSYQRCG